MGVVVDKGSVTCVFRLSRTLRAGELVHSLALRAGGSYILPMLQTAFVS